MNHPTVCWEGSRAGHEQPRRFPQGVEDSILTQTLDELTKAGQIWLGMGRMRAAMAAMTMSWWRSRTTSRMTVQDCRRSDFS